jgi:hypothetical protein
LISNIRGKKEKRRKKIVISKDLKIILILSIVFLSSLSYLSLFLFDFTFKIYSEEVSLEIPAKEDIYEEYSKNLEIIRPKGTLEQPLPLVILLNGQFLSSRSMNLIQKEFLSNNYAVALFNIDNSETRVFRELESLLEEIRTKSNVDSTRIGLIGHSYGAHYAFQFGISTSEIRGVICGNLGPFELFTTNFYDLPERNIPNNLLLIMNENSSYNNQPPEEYLRYSSSGYATDINVFYGNFEDGSAREAYVSNSFFGHASLLYDPIIIKKEIQWMNQSLGIEGEEASLFSLFIQVISMFLLFSLLIISGFGLFAKIIVQMNIISKYLNSSNLSSHKFKNKKGILKKKQSKGVPIKDEIIHSEENKEDSEKNLLLQRNSTNLNNFPNKNKDIVGKYSFFLFISTFIVISSQYIYYNLIYWFPSLQNNYIGDLIGNIFDLSILIDSKFPFEFMYVWAVLFLVIKITLFRNLTSSKLISYSIIEHLFSLIKALIMFGFLLLMLKIVTSFIVGFEIPKIYVQNLILAFFIIYCINFSSFLFIEELGDNSKANMKIFLFILFNYACLLLPEILFQGFGNFFKNYFVFFIFSLLNPTMYKKKIGLLTISWFNYFFIIFAAILSF